MVGLVMYTCLLSCVRFRFSVLSREIGWEERLQNDLFCVRWDIKPVSQSSSSVLSSCMLSVPAASRVNDCVKNLLPAMLPFSMVRTVAWKMGALSY